MDNLLTDDQLLASYRNSWLTRKVVNIPALDALRRWRDWQADQADITKIEAEEKRLGLQTKLLRCQVLARLWGGAAIFIGTGSADLSQPLEPDSVARGGLKYLTVMSRRELAVDGLDEDPVSEFYGKPKRYQVISGRGNDFLEIHPSRLAVQIGQMHPDPWLATGSSYGWGDSVLQSGFTALQNADSTSANIATLVFEACVDVFKVPGLMENMGDKVYRDKILERFTLAAAGKSITKALLMDGEEEYERRQTAFSTLPDVMQAFFLQVGGAYDIPMTRLMGQSPGGMNSTGEHDMNNYQDNVTARQELEIQPSIWRLDECLIRSALGARPDELFYLWAPLQQMNEKQRAEIGKIHADTANVLSQTNLFLPEELREVVGNQLVETGLYPGLGDLLQTNGMDLPEFDEPAVPTVDPMTGQPVAEQVAQDARPRTLYMWRPVVNARDILDHFRSQGVQGLYAPENLHVTIAYSKTAVDWMRVGEPWEAEIKVAAGGPRMMELFGPERDVLVLLFTSRELAWRHQAVREAGGSSDFNEYQPHLSISLKGWDGNVDDIAPWTGPIVLGPEVFEETASGDWRKLVKTES
jgi:phage-related protein (TIGR01555 family)